MFGFLNLVVTEKVKCAICGKNSKLVAKTLKVCVDCIRATPEKAEPYIQKAHDQSRRRFGLPEKPPRAAGGVKCKICVNTCQIPKNGMGFCGLRTNNGRLKHLAGTPSKGVLEWYYDPLPTNCVGDWICPGGTGTGFPKYSYSDNKPEHGFKNLAVFYGACTFDCLFCQNWHYRRLSTSHSSLVSAEELASAVDTTTSCICYFGGDPTPQLMHAIKTSKIALEENNNRILRLCWESNGSMVTSCLDQIAELSLVSGGCVKLDLKFFDENLNIALCGVTNRQTLANFEYLGKFIDKRPDPLFLIASTLLIPGYVDEIEVKNIAEFIAAINPEIPYSLLAFHPSFEMKDMPVTSKKQAMDCLRAAEKAGLKRVKIGNIHLL